METSDEQVVGQVLYSESNVSASSRFTTRRVYFVWGRQSLDRAWLRSREVVLWHVCPTRTRVPQESV
jgi:hypothetical protein